MKCHDKYPSNQQVVGKCHQLSTQYAPLNIIQVIKLLVCNTFLISSKQFSQSNNNNNNNKNDNNNSNIIRFLFTVVSWLPVPLV